MNQKDMFKIETYIVAYYNSWTNEFEHLKPFDNYKEASDYKEAQGDVRYVLLGEIKE